jgi:hypothetical protein
VSFDGAKVAAVGRLVNLDAAFQRPVVVSQEGPDLLEHPVRGLVGDADFALQLLRADPAAGRGHQVDRVEPKLKAHRRLVEDRPGGRVDLMPAAHAGVGGAALDPKELRLAPAAGALRAVREEPLAQVFEAGVVVRE